MDSLYNKSPNYEPWNFIFNSGIYVLLVVFTFRRLLWLIFTNFFSIIVFLILFSKFNPVRKFYQYNSSSLALINFPCGAKMFVKMFADKIQKIYNWKGIGEQ